METGLLHRRRLIALAGGIVLGAPLAARAAAAPAFAMTSIVLYLPEAAIRERGPTVQEFELYINALKAQANYTLSKAPTEPGVSGALVIGLKPPARSRVWIVASDPARKAGLVGLLKAPLEAIAPPEVSGLNAFALNFNAWGGSGAPGVGYPIPDEWKAGMTKGGILPDTPMQAVWPD
jgi:hypothetical protein